MWQRCQAHFERNILSSVSDKHRIHLRQQLKDMFNAPSEEEAIRRKDLIIENHSGKTFEKAMKCLENGFDEVCVVYGLPEHHRIKMRTSNIIERLNEEIRRRERQYETTSTNECKSWIYRVNCRCIKKTETDLPHTLNEGRYEQENIYWNGCPLF